ncbi:MAG: hypothetical protein BGN87_13135 [Rhizobiales bacterium 65-79]|nr:hypothetical protein [Hyphomicrobiales bacterium]OJU06205.1 MAG: hypothetical protein BGN87_13135 [Rhizobiales bacterium 65-79]
MATRSLLDAIDIPGRSMTMTWHNGQYIRQEHAAEDVAAWRDYLVEELAWIEASCEVRPVVALDHLSEIAVMINQSFGTHVLDAANIDIPSSSG